MMKVAAFVALSLGLSVGAANAQYDPNRPLTAEDVKAMIEFSETVTRVQALQTQIALGIKGDVAESCMRRLLAHYSHPGEDKTWPFDQNWRDEKGWKNFGAFSEAMQQRDKFDEAHMLLCVKGYAKSN